MAIAPERQRAAIYEGTRIPRPCPTTLVVSDELRATGDVMTVNFGPNHPSTHGVLRLIVDLNGEDVVGLEAVVGYLHTGFEKNMEAKTWWKAITYPERIDYLSFQNNELVFVLAIEQLLGARDAAEGRLDAHLPVRAQPDPLAPRLARHRPRSSWVRSRCSGTASASASRSSISSRWSAATRMHTRYFQAGGLAEDIPRGFFPEARKFCDWMPQAIDEYEQLVNRNKIWLERTVGLGLLSADDAIALGQSGPGAARVGRRLGPAARAAVPHLRRVRVRRARLPRGRRLRPLPGAHGGDARVGEDRRAVPRPARADGGRAVDRRRPQGRAAAARGAPHLDGVADPPLQDRHRGLPRPRGRGLRRPSSRRAASSAATSSPTAGRGRGG